MRSIVLVAEAREDGNCQFRRGWRGQMQSFQQRLEETVADVAEPQEMSIILLAEAREDGSRHLSRGWEGTIAVLQAGGRSPVKVHLGGAEGDMQLQFF